MSIEAEFFRQIQEHMKETEQRRFNEFVANGALEPVSYQTILNTVKSMNDFCVKNSNVIFVNPKTKREILAQYKPLPLTYFVASECVPENTAYVVTDNEMKQIMIETLGGDICL